MRHARALRCRFGRRRSAAFSRIRSEDLQLRQFGQPRLWRYLSGGPLDHQPKVVRGHRSEVNRAGERPRVEASVLGMKKGVERGAVLQILSRKLNRHRGRTRRAQNDFVDPARPGEMHPYPLWQVLKLVALPMARPKRIVSIRSMIHGARNLLFGLLAAERERAVLDLRPRFTRERQILVVARRLGSSALTQRHQCENKRRKPCRLFEESHETLYPHCRGIRTFPPPLRLLTYETGHFIRYESGHFHLLPTLPDRRSPAQHSTLIFLHQKWDHSRHAASSRTGRQEDEVLIRKPAPYGTALRNAQT